MDGDRRELEGRVFEQLAALDALILEADREIERLQLALYEGRRILPGDRPLTADEQQACFALREAGLSPQDVARQLSTSLQRVNETLNQFHDRAA